MPRHGRARNDMVMTPVYTYGASRCHALWGCWILDNSCAIAPAGWQTEHILPGQYRITPAAADIPDTRRAVPVATLSWMDTNEQWVEARPEARTFLIVRGDSYYEVTILDSTGTPVDGSFAFLVLSPY